MLQELICHQPEGACQPKALQEILPFPASLNPEIRGAETRNLLSSPPAALCFERHSTTAPGQSSLQTNPAVLSLRAMITEGFKGAFSTELRAW